MRRKKKIKSVRREIVPVLFSLNDYVYMVLFRYMPFFLE